VYITTRSKIDPSSAMFVRKALAETMTSNVINAFISLSSHFPAIIARRALVAKMLSRLVHLFLSLGALGQFYGFFLELVEVQI
jgi:hypothetical protein